MINNRQNGRRRGRNNGPRPEGGSTPNRAPTGGGGGSRIDNRQRGNAHQLHEKYKTLARDSQMQGDRVTAEYYLQYADHYFRVLNEGRARQEEFRSRQQNWDGEGEGEDERGQSNGRDGGEGNLNGYRGDYDQGDGGEAEGNADGNGNSNRGNGDGRQQQRYERNDRAERNDRGDRGERNDRGERAERSERPDRGDRNERPEQRREAPQRSEVREERPQPLANVDANDTEQDEPRAAARPRGRPPRQPRQPIQVESENERFDLVGLPPRASIVPPAEPIRAEEAAGEPEVTPAPRKRGRPKKTELTEA